jgi:hypothetical protein
VPEQVPPQPDARFAVRWDLHGGRGSLELCLSLAAAVTRLSRLVGRDD